MVSSIGTYDEETIWDMWHLGFSLKAIGRALGKTSSSIHHVVKQTGGIRPQPRKRCRSSLSLEEREEISRGLVRGDSIRAIARALRRHASTISREVNRNGGAEVYRALHADEAGWHRARRPKICKLALNRHLCRLVASKLKKRWSPQQIAGWLKRRYPEDVSKHVSHETIYKSLFIQSRGVLKQELIKTLRRKKTRLRQSKTKRVDEKRGQIKDLVSIRERPASIEDRAIPGHWEGDLIDGTRQTHIATLVERHTRYVMLVKVENKETKTVVPALINQMKKLPKELLKTVTWDRGKELASHQQFSVATNAEVYFCDPQSPWQRGTNENTNGLLRQYFPKGTDLSVYSQSDLNKVARELNTRPRKTLNYDTPAVRFYEHVASTD